MTGPTRSQDTPTAQPGPGDGPGSAANMVQPPVLSLPKGGGAIRGIGEKFGANPVTGTGSMAVPIATSAGRSGFGPQLSLTYDSGAGNGPHGLGWQLSTPAITRKTNQGIPRYVDELPIPPTYHDITDPDVFVLSDVEDLVPVFRQDHDRTWVTAHPGYTRDADGDWVRDAAGRLIIHEDDRIGYRIRRYRPRIEGLFARIERWTNLADPADVHWRSISKTNVLSIYGATAESRITDPHDDRATFSWLLCQTRDDKGNAVIYGYRADDATNVDFAAAHERNRGPATDPRRNVNRYLKRIRYGNGTPLIDPNTGQRPELLEKAEIDGAQWMFEVVFDYGDHDPDRPTPTDDSRTDATGHPLYPWPVRPDPFSTYRPGFEIRTLRRCTRVLMFHHFPGSEGDGVGTDCLVQSTDFTYSDDTDPPTPDNVNPRYSFLTRITHTGYRRSNIGDPYRRASLPALELEYSQPVIAGRVEDVPHDQLTHLPVGLDNAGYTWTDLHGEGIPGILTEQADTWFYQRNLSPDTALSNDHGDTVRFGPLEVVAAKPNTTLAAHASFMDLAGDGQPDLVQFDGPTPGLFEHDTAEGWKPFRAFGSRLNRDMRDPNLRLIDLVGDGHSDVLISEHDGFQWHQSLAEDGFGPANQTSRALDEEHGPRIVFADVDQTVFLADLSGDGLTDIVRIRNGDVCYWPNLGYGRFGAKITMDHAPQFTDSLAFDSPERFDANRIRLADIDGSGTTDIIYLHPDGVRLYFNQSGNSWTPAQILSVFPPVDALTTIAPTDLLGTGTACLVWSSPSPSDATTPMRYVNLMAAGKPHLLIKAANNLGAETRIHYAHSTQFYLRDKHEGRPWNTRLPFPVHVVERVDTIDYVGRTRFVTRYAYHDGYFDGDEREFRGFGMVEQWDTEEFAVLAGDPATQDWINQTPGSHVPPVRTKTWFHTGAPTVDDKTRRRDYFSESGLTPAQADAMLLPDTVLPAHLDPAEEREAIRALKGSMLRSEVYADDAAPGSTAAQRERARRPYIVTEQNFTVEPLQRQATNRHGVFFTHPRETITYHYDRSADDPRVQHALTLDVDEYGNVREQATIGYGRRHDDTALPTNADRIKQRLILLTATETTLTNPILDVAAYRAPMAAASRTYELRTPHQAVAPDGPTVLYQFDAVAAILTQAGDGHHDVDYEDLDFSSAQTDPAQANKYFRRLIEHTRTLYRSDDLTTLLPLGKLESLALTGESYQLAFTAAMLEATFQRPRPLMGPEDLLPNPAGVLASTGGGGGGYLLSKTAKDDGRFPAEDPDDRWWLPSGRVGFSPDQTATPAAELALARLHFYLPRRFQNPFGHNTFVDYDRDLLVAETRDALDNRVTADANDYRVLQPRLVSDPNRNQTAVTFDTLGMMVGTAIMGKSGAAEGDTLTGFIVDPTPAQLNDVAIAPRQPDGAATKPTTVIRDLLGGASSRIVYDMDRFRRTKADNPTDSTKWEPTFTMSIARETHVSALAGAQQAKISISLSYSDGFGREIQRKLQAEPGPLTDGGPVVNPRWVGSGWTIYNNKGKPVRQYEPFFTATHQFEFAAASGVSPILFYDPVDRVVATLYPNHTYDKAVFDPWQQTSCDTNDTCAQRNTQTGDPRTDPDIAGYVAAYFAHLAASNPAQPWQTWYAQRATGALGTLEQTAAGRAADHADTPTTTHFDTLGRVFLTHSRNRVVCPGHPLNNQYDDLYSRVDLDIEGNQRTMRDAVTQAGDDLGRIIMRYVYNMLGTRIQQSSMESGARWIVSDATGKPIRSWDSRGHNVTTTYDELRRPLTTIVRGTTANSDQRTIAGDVTIETLDYGEPLATASPADKQRAITLNLRTRLYRHRDPAGVATNAALDATDTPTEAFDFKGNLLSSTRRFTVDYTALPNWQNPPQLQDESFTITTRYDALNRPIQTIAPHSSKARAKRNITQPTYNDTGFLDRVDVWLGQNDEPTALMDPTMTAPSRAGVANIDYDAKGKRQRIEYKNGTSTHYTYDRDTFRLTDLYTRRDGRYTEDCANPQTPPPDSVAAPPAPPPGKPCGVQNLHYTYDPVGNITHIRDDAQQTLFFRNQRVEPSNDYIYDALYQLVQATGREHLGQNGGIPRPPTPSDPFNTFHTGLAHPGDGAAMGTYTEQYVYDAVGNITTIAHKGNQPASAGWTMTYDYSETSQTENGTAGGLLKTSNRLSSTHLNAGPQAPYRYDLHGNTTFMQHLSMGSNDPNLVWDYADRLRHVARDDGADYVYDSAGQRVRKIWHKSVGHTEERIYLGGFELFRTYQGPITADDPELERETLHVMDDQRRIALVETRTLGNVAAPEQLIRYQHDNHLGSAAVELDGDAKILSYEEYAPYGSSTYQAIATETPKRYRYTGKERDEETGLQCHGARFYAPWLGRWASADSSGLIDGPNLYRYARGRPIVLFDPGGHDSESYDPQTIAVSAAALRQLVALRAAAAPLVAGTAGAGAGAETAVVAGVSAEAAPAGGGAAAGGAAGAGGALVAAQIVAGAAMALSVRLHMQRSAAIVTHGNPWGVSRTDTAFPTIAAARDLRSKPFPIPTPSPTPAPSPEPDPGKKEQRLGRIYVTYTKENKDTGLVYSGRTSMVIDLNKPWRAQAELAVKARDANHHIDENDEPTDPTFTPAKVDEFAVGYAVDYDERYRDVGYLAIRGREQQLIDYNGAKAANERGITDFRGGARSDTRPGTPLTENAVRAVAKDNVLGEEFHAASNVAFTEIAPFTGNRILSREKAMR